MTLWAEITQVPAKATPILWVKRAPRSSPFFRFFRFFGLDALNAKAESHTKRGCTTSSDFLIRRMEPTKEGEGLGSAPPLRRLPSTGRRGPRLHWSCGGFPRSRRGAGQHSDMVPGSASEERLPAAFNTDETRPARSFESTRLPSGERAGPPLALHFRLNAGGAGVFERSLLLRR